MKHLLIILVFILASCETWDYGETYTQHINAGEHYAKPVTLKFTEVWGGKCTLEYNPEQMTIPDGWSKLGGIMEKITDNIGEKNSARIAFRADPDDFNYFFLGSYIYDRGEVFRDYLLDMDGQKVRVRVGDEFEARIVPNTTHWGLYVTTGTQQSEYRYNTNISRDLLVQMDLYYGGENPAPCDIDLTIQVVDTNWNYTY